MADNNSNRNMPPQQPTESHTFSRYVIAGIIFILLLLLLYFYISQHKSDDTVMIEKETVAEDTVEDSDEKESKSCGFWSRLWGKCETAEVSDESDKVTKDEDETSTDTKTAEDPKAPQFDIARIHPVDRSAVIAGKATPHAAVTLMALNDLTKEKETLGTIKADENGEWVMISNKKLSPDHSQISAYSVDIDGVKHESDQVIYPIISEEGDEKNSMAVRMDKNGEGDVKVLQGPAPDQDAETRYTLEAIVYNEMGRIRASGRAPKETAVKVYLDDKLISDAEVGNSGDWNIDTKVPLEQKTYKVRVDFLDSKGDVVKRLENDFKPEIYDVKEGRTYTVKKGDCLWNIAIRHYGRNHGPEYVIIYKANKKQIKNPNLIYPGQVFTIPYREEKAPAMGSKR